MTVPIAHATTEAPIACSPSRWPTSWCRGGRCHTGCGIGSLWLLVFALLAWSWRPAEMFRVSALFTDWRNMAEFGNAFLKPNFHDWDNYLSDMLITIQIALWGTALAVVSSAFRFPFSAPPTSVRYGSCSRCAA